MAHPDPSSRRMTVEEFLDWEDAQPARHEFVAGDVYAMSGVTRRHNEISLNIAALLRLPLERQGAGRTWSTCGSACATTSSTTPTSWSPAARRPRTRASRTRPASSSRSSPRPRGAPPSGLTLTLDAIYEAIELPPPDEVLRPREAEAEYA